MQEVIAAHPAFSVPSTVDDWLPENPFPVATERELATLAAGKPVYRCWFQRDASAANDGRYHQGSSATPLYSTP
jgi:tRNA (guanine-N7-)-methyltransferase